jgi:hypothetical protein
MGKLRRYRRPLTTLAVVAVIDFGGRLLVDFDVSRIVAFEAVLFGVAAALLGWAARRPDATDPGVCRVERWLAAFFALGGLRAGLWAAGLAVQVANGVVLALAATAGVGLWLRRRVRRHRSATSNVGLVRRDDAAPDRRGSEATGP